MIRYLLAAMLVASTGTAFAASGGSPNGPSAANQQQNLIVTSAVVDYDRQQMVITGVDLLPNGFAEGDFIETIVQVNEGIPLNIVAGTPYELLLDFPLDSLAAGDYILTVKTGNGASQQDKWNLTIGASGPRGDTGAVGPQGDKGEKGDTGAVGPQGDKGEKGDTGAVGPQGDKGEKGDTGAVGPQGETGRRGERGPAGSSFAGYWNNVTTYEQGQMVGWGSGVYVSLRDRNIGNNPEQTGLHRFGCDTVFKLDSDSPSWVAMDRDPPYCEKQYGWRAGLIQPGQCSNHQPLGATLKPVTFKRIWALGVREYYKSNYVQAQLRLFTDGLLIAESDSNNLISRPTSPAGTHTLQVCNPHDVPIILPSYRSWYQAAGWATGE